jgi:hypothetical protein
MKRREYEFTVSKMCNDFSVLHIPDTTFPGLFYPRSARVNESLNVSSDRQIFIRLSTRKHVAGSPHREMDTLMDIDGSVLLPDLHRPTLAYPVCWLLHAYVTLSHVHASGLPDKKHRTDFSTRRPDLPRRRASVDKVHPGPSHLVSVEPDRAASAGTCGPRPMRLGLHI